MWYRVKVYEERIRRNVTTDADGNRRENISHYWHLLVDDERFTDFYLQDGAHKLFINGSNRGLCRIQVHTKHCSSSGTTVVVYGTNHHHPTHHLLSQGAQDFGRSSFFNAPPPGIQMLIASRLTGWGGWGSMGHRTGRFRYEEASFDVNELVAALGVVSPAKDPYTQQPVKVLNPFTSTTLNEAFFEDNEWTDWDKRSWNDLCKSPAVLLSDKQHFTRGVQVAPAAGLPAYMTSYQPHMVNAAMYGPGGGVVVMNTGGAAYGGAGYGAVAMPGAGAGVYAPPMAQ